MSGVEFNNGVQPKFGGKGDYAGDYGYQYFETGQQTSRGAFSGFQRVAPERGPKRDVVVRANAPDIDRFSVVDAGKNLIKGVLSPVKAIFDNPIQSIAMIAVTGALVALNPAVFIPLLTIGGGLFSTYQLGKGTVDAVYNYMDGNYDAAEEAFQNIGAGGTGVALTMVGVKASAKAAIEAKETARVLSYTDDVANSSDDIVRAMHAGVKKAQNTKNLTMKQAIMEHVDLVATKEGRNALKLVAEPRIYQGRIKGFMNLIQGKNSPTRNPMDAHEFLDDTVKVDVEGINQGQQGALIKAEAVTDGTKANFKPGEFVRFNRDKGAIEVLVADGDTPLQATRMKMQSQYRRAMAEARVHYHGVGDADIAGAINVSLAKHAGLSDDAIKVLQEGEGLAAFVDDLDHYQARVRMDAAEQLSPGTITQERFDELKALGVFDDGLDANITFTDDVAKLEADKVNAIKAHHKAKYAGKMDNNAWVEQGVVGQVADKLRRHAANSDDAAKALGLQFADGTDEATKIAKARQVAQRLVDNATSHQKNVYFGDFDQIAAIRNSRGSQTPKGLQIADDFYRGNPDELIGIYLDPEPQPGVQGAFQSARRRLFGGNGQSPALNDNALAYIAHQELDGAMALVNHDLKHYGVIIDGDTIRYTTTPENLDLVQLRRLLMDREQILAHKQALTAGATVRQRNLALAEIEAEYQAEMKLANEAGGDNKAWKEFAAKRRDAKRKLLETPEQATEARTFLAEETNNPGITVNDIGGKQSLADLSATTTLAQPTPNSIAPSMGALLGTTTGLED